MPPILPPLIVVVGPTCSGKTDYGVKLAKLFNGEVINADSRQIYREIDIASAKPKLEINNLKFDTYLGVPHHLFGIVRPDEEFNVTHFKTHALEIIHDIHERGALPFLVGGTGLWIDAVVDNYIFPIVPTKEKRRKNYPYYEEYNKGDTNSQEITHRHIPHDISTHDLYQQLITKDPGVVKFINANNRRRILRALEVIEATGVPFSDQRNRAAPLFHTLMLGVSYPIHELEERIMKRLEEQVREGLEDEARRVLATHDQRLPALSSISMREWKEYFDGTRTRDETLTRIALHNRQYAKRQMTWFKKNPRVQWITSPENAQTAIAHFLGA